ncbi:cytochrome o ubiquinol oxidase subunit III [Paraburkholderia acidipaludis]|uniref:cytochrome o ubiquinol oxidase subunit III n=1 Tax=Paraburkholderia acidipaludis TaxID=660537 RepID=UPI000487B376|nr:cytochrome o ubiquinol oxidase subunit III [Paraburkholderia acidipaludis]
MAHAAIHHSGHAHGHDHDSTPKTTFGFWIYLMSDCLIFATLFATFGVLANATAGGPGAKQLFEPSYVLGETLLLLASSVTFGMAMLNLHAQRRAAVIAWLAVTFAFGAGFIGMEVNEFAKLVAENAGPGTSAYLSAYFTLVGTHGLHVTVGLLWIALMMHQTLKFGLTGTIRRRLACLSLFWHFLDLVWICVFTFVYLRGLL